MKKEWHQKVKVVKLPYPHIPEREILKVMPKKEVEHFNNFMNGQGCLLLDNGDSGIYESDFLRFVRICIKKETERKQIRENLSRFKKEFSRSLGSGNRWSQIKNMPSHAKETLTGDLCCPEGFKFVIESKGGYSKIDLNGVFENGNSELDSFMKQAEDDAAKRMAVYKSVGELMK